MSGKAVIGTGEMVGKIEAAVAARRDPDCCSSPAPTPPPSRVWTRRSTGPARYAGAGADALFVEAPTSEDDIARVAGELRGVAPLVFNWAEGGRTPPICRWPGSPSSGSRWCSSRSAPCSPPPPASGRCWRPCAPTARRPRRCPGCPTFDGFTDLIGLPEVRELEQRFGG